MVKLLWENGEIMDEFEYLWDNAQKMGDLAQSGSLEKDCEFGNCE
jgi:hypothetical protein